jgi:nucleotide-binding universal stress UspA family protein
MFKNILLPTDGSPLSDKATAQAIELARTHGGRIVALSVIQPFPIVTLAGDSGMVAPDAELYEQQMRNAARGFVDRVSAAASAANVPCEGIVALSPSPHKEIVAAAGKYGCDAIVMASHGRTGLNKLLLGSETQKVLAHTELPVLVLR